jgi:hypothetical protein
MVGIISIIGIYGVQQYLLTTPSFQMEVVTSTFKFGYILIFIFLVLYPTLLLIFQIDTKKIKKILKKSGITEKDLFIDYMAAINHGKTKIGKLCTYSSTFYRYYIIPNEKILTVIKKIKVKKIKKAVRYKNGATQRILYNISTRKQYFVSITDIYCRTIFVACNKEKTVDEIIDYYHQYPNILFIDPQSRNARKKAREMRKKMLEKERIENEK